jgi:hypothetical protein
LTAPVLVRRGLSRSRKQKKSVITVVRGLTGYHHYVWQHLHDYTEIEFKDQLV